MNFSLYKFVLIPEHPAFLGNPLPFIIRSTLGNTLKKLTCVLKLQECHDCILKNTCIYSQFFEVIPPPKECPNFVTEHPKPFVLKCDKPLKMKYDDGDELSFDIGLFGKANEFLPYLVLAVREMCKMGIGKKNRDGERTQFKLKRVVQDGVDIFDGSQNIKLNNPISLELPLLEEKVDRDKSLEIRFLSPLRIKSQNHLRDDLTFFDFFKAVLRRIHSLECAFGDKELEIDYDGLLKISKEVKVTELFLKWDDWRRYSGRQRTEMLMGGVLGRMKITGENLDVLLPYLRYAEKVSVGKQTTFGLGRVEVGVWE